MDDQHPAAAKLKNLMTILTLNHESKWRSQQGVTSLRRSAIINNMSENTEPVAMTTKAFEAEFAFIRLIIGLAVTVLAAIGLTATQLDTAAWLVICVSALLVAVVILGCYCMSFVPQAWIELARMQSHILNTTSDGVKISVSPYLSKKERRSIGVLYVMFSMAMVLFLIGTIAVCMDRDSPKNVAEQGAASDR